MAGSTAPSMDTIYPRIHARLSPLRKAHSALAKRSAEWFLHEKRWQKSRKWCDKALVAFTAHPEETDETYLQHLWFTVKTSTHFIALGLVLFMHGLFPFLFTHTVSTHLEGIYRMMRARIPKSRRDRIDEYSI